MKNDMDTVYPSDETGLRGREGIVIKAKEQFFKAPVAALVAGGRSRDKIQYMEEETEMKKKLAAVLTAAASHSRTARRMQWGSVQ